MRKKGWVTSLFFFYHTSFTLVLSVGKLGESFTTSQERLYFSLTLVSFTLLPFVLILILNEMLRVYYASENKKHQKLTKIFL